MAALLALVLVYLGVTFVQVWSAGQATDPSSREAIVVLGAAQYDGRPSPALEGRLLLALELYRDGVAPLIVVTGGRQDGDTYTEATSGYNWLRARGVPDAAILKEVQGHSTYESLAATARFLRRRDISEVVLVSDAPHALRVESVAEEVGLEPQVAPVRTLHRSTAATIQLMTRETIAVAIGRITGYRRLTRITG